MHWRLWAYALLASAAAAQSETYTLLHRVQSIGEDGKQIYTPWQPRALIRYPTTVAGAEGLVVNEGLASEMNFPDDDTNAFYQLKVVHGDTRELSAEHWKSHVDGDNGFVTFAKLVRVLITQCQLRTHADAPLEDTVELHLSRPPLEIGDESTPPQVVGLSYGIQPRTPYDDQACPIFQEKGALHSSAFTTTVSVSVPAPPETYVDFSRRPLRITKKPEDETPEEAAKKKANEPFDPIQFLRKYWLYLLPIVILFMVPMPEDVPEQPQRRPPSNAPSGVAGRVAPGPGKGPVASAAGAARRR